MRKSTKPFLWGLALVGVLLLAVFLLLNTLLSPERIKRTLVPVLSAALERDVQVENIEIGLFSGITAERFAILDPKTGEALLKAEKSVLQFQLWPLLSKRVVIDRIQFDAPELTLVRQPDGSFNTAVTKETSAREAAATGVQDSGAGQTAGLNLLVSEVVINNGTLLFVDKKLNADAPFRYQVKNFNLKATQVALDREFPLEVSGELEHATFRLQGSANLALPGGSFKLNTEQLDLAAFAPYFRDALPGNFSRASLSMALEIALSADQMVVNGDVNLQGINLVMDAAKDFPIRDGELALKLDLLADLAHSSLTIRPSGVRFNQIATQLQGEVQNWDTTARIDLALAVDKLKLRDAIASLPAELTAKTNGLDPAGTVSFQARVAGRVDQDPLGWVQQASMQLEDLQVNLGNVRPSLSGPMTLKDQTLTAKGLRFAEGDHQATVDITVTNILARPLHMVTDFRAEKLDLDALLADGLEADSRGATDAAAGPEHPSPQREPGPYHLPVDWEGVGHIKQAKVHGLLADDIEVHSELKNNVLSIKQLTARVGAGSFGQTARIDLTKQGLEYQSAVKMNQIPGNMLLAALAPDLRGVVLGNIDLDCSMSGRGTGWEKLSKALIANGSAKASGLQLSNAPVASALADFLQVPELKDVDFNDVKADFKVSKGVSALNASLLGPQVKVTPQGSVSLDGALNLALPTALAPQLASRLGESQLTNLFVDSQGWTELPIKVKGRIDAPEFKLDAKVVRKKAVNKIEEQILKKLVPKQPDGKPADPKQQLLEKALKGLLGS